MESIGMLINLEDMNEDYRLKYLIEDEEIIGCELALSDDAKCISCKKKITKDTPRIWIIGEYRCPPPDEGIKKIRKFICYKCSKQSFGMKKREYVKAIEKGEMAREQLRKLEPIHSTYLNYLKEDIISKRIKADELMRELENGEEGN